MKDCNEDCPKDYAKKCKKRKSLIVRIVLVIFCLLFISALIIGICIKIKDRPDDTNIIINTCEPCTCDNNTIDIVPNTGL